MYKTGSRLGSVQNFNSPLKSPIPKKQYLSLRHPVLAPLDSDPSGNESSQISDKENQNEESSSPTNCLLLQTKMPNSIFHSQDCLKPPLVSSSPNVMKFKKTPLFPKPIPKSPPQNSNHNNNHEDPINFLSPQNRIMIAPPTIISKQANSDQPVIDSFIPSVLRIMCALSVAPTDIQFPELPKLPKVEDAQFDSVFSQKIEICSQVIDFTNTNEQLPQKEIKTRTICEFIELFENSNEVSKLNANHQKLIFDMLYKNIFRQTPFFPSKIICNDYSLNVIDPGWTHLFYCYQILNRFIQVFPESPLITFDIIKQAIDLTELPDSNERMQLVAFLRSYFGIHPDDRQKILKYITQKLINVHEGVANPFCVLPLIIFVSHMFSKSSATSLNDFTKTVKEGILPLVGLPYLPMYHSSIKQLLSNIVSSDVSLAPGFLRSIELQWPIAEGTKQVYFLSILIGIWEKMNLPTFKPMAPRVFTFLADYVESPNAKVSQTILEIWDNVADDGWVALNSRAAIRAMYESVVNVVEKSWNTKCVEKASKALSEMCRINKHAYQKMKAYLNQIRAQRYRPRVPNDTQKGWSSIAKKAAELGDDSFNLKDKLKYLRDVFHNEKKPTLAVSRFTPVLEKHKIKEKDSEN